MQEVSLGLWDLVMLEKWNDGEFKHERKQFLWLGYDPTTTLSWV